MSSGFDRGFQNKHWKNRIISSCPILYSRLIHSIKNVHSSLQQWAVYWNTGTLVMYGSLGYDIPFAVPFLFWLLISLMNCVCLGLLVACIDYNHVQYLCFFISFYIWVILYSFPLKSDIFNIMNSPIPSFTLIHFELQSGVVCSLFTMTFSFLSLPSGLRPILVTFIIICVFYFVTICSFELPGDNCCHWCEWDIILSYSLLWNSPEITAYDTS